ncbi:MAG: CRTAC1 family protein [Deltaproteobacteria bacterium]|nr:CRTAC1 family protein [Deltaproteobacteria bacterium]MCB9785706.1 CRTAC1 family protein [Deltaproteobacteria bacterium]
MTSRELVVAVLAALSLAACAGETEPRPPSPEQLAPSAGVSGVLFWDVTQVAGLDLVRTPVDDYLTVPDRFTGGVCVLDADGRGAPDLFFALREGAGARSTLYVADQPFAYQDQTERRGLGHVGEGSGCLAFDADGDGDDDLLVTRLGGISLFEHRGDRFVDVSGRIPFTAHPGDLFTSAAAGDLDGDGDLDLVVGGYVRYAPELIEPGTSCAPSVCTAQPHPFPAISSRLFLRDGDTFRDVTAERAPELAMAWRTTVVAIRDLDGDGRPDIYAAHDLQDWNQALIQDADGTFHDRAVQLGLAHDRNDNGLDAMGFSSGDIDGDGRLDHVLTGFTNDATAVFMCQPDGTCPDQADQVGTTALEQTFRWGAALADFDLDGWLDLAEATGHVFSQPELDAFDQGPQAQPTNFMRGDGAGHLIAHIPVPEDGLATRRLMRGIAVADLDDDGRPDLVLAPSSGRPALLRNVMAPRGHWLRVVLPPGAVGAVVRATLPGGRVLMRQRTAGEGYLGSFDSRLLFGLGDALSADLEITWPDGHLTTRAQVPADAEVTLAP